MMELVHSVDLHPDQLFRDAVGQGDARQALEILMDAYGKSVYRYCSRMLRNAEAAEDAMQTTFLQAFKDCQTFQNRSSLRTWLFGIAHHRCLDALKSQRRKSAPCDPLEEAIELSDGTHSPEDAAAANERRGALLACLDELDPQVRMPVLLRYKEDFSYPEIGAICGVRAATLQVRVARAMPLLRRCLERKGIC